jgi:putative membrane protein
LRGFIVGTIVTAIAFYVLTKVLPQYTGFDMVSYKGDLAGILVISLIFGVVNGLIGPIVRTLAFPLTFMTMGLIGFVINAGLLLLTALISKTAGFDLTVGDYPPTLLSANTFVAAIVGAVVLSAVSTVVRLVVRD